MSTFLTDGNLPETGTILDSYVTLDHIPKMARIALWKGRLFRGTVTLWAGAGATGKGLTGVCIGAAVVTGGLMPGESPDTDRDRTPARVIGVWPEDDANEDLAYRWDAAVRRQLEMQALDAALAKGELAEPEPVSEDEVQECLARVINLTESLEDQPFTLGKSMQSAGDMRAVIDLYAQTDDNGEYVNGPPVTFVLIDPLLAVTDKIGSNAAARAVVQPLMVMAKETGVAIMLTHHTTKDGQIAGSKGLTDVLRLVYTATWDALNEGVVVVHKTKGNNVGKVADMRYSIEGGEQDPVVAWKVPEIAAAKPAKQQQPKSQSWRSKYPQAKSSSGSGSHHGRHHHYSSHKSAAPAPAPAPVAPEPVQRPSEKIWGSGPGWLSKQPA